MPSDERGNRPTDAEGAEFVSQCAPQLPAAVQTSCVRLLELAVLREYSPEERPWRGRPLEPHELRLVGPTAIFPAKIVEVATTTGQFGLSGRAVRRQTTE